MQAVSRVINVDDFAPEELTQSARRLAQASMKAAV